MTITVLEQDQIRRLTDKNDRAFNRYENTSEQVYVQNMILLEIVKQLSELKQAIVDGVTVEHIGEQE